MKKYGIVNMNKLTLFFPSVIAVAVICFSGCFDSSQKESKLVVINVLDQKYYDDCHIKGSINIPFDEFENQLQKYF